MVIKEFEGKRYRFEKTPTIGDFKRFQTAIRHLIANCIDIDHLREVYADMIGGYRVNATTLDDATKIYNDFMKQMKSMTIIELSNFYQSLLTFVPDDKKDLIIYNAQDSKLLNLAVMISDIDTERDEASEFEEEYFGGDDNEQPMFDQEQPIQTCSISEEEPVSEQNSKIDDADSSNSDSELGTDQNRHPDEE